MAFMVTNCAFNRAWYPALIGKIFADPPAYAIVAPVRIPDAR